MSSFCHDNFISGIVFQYIVDAVHLLATEGWKLLPLYRFDPVTGMWTHIEGEGQAPACVSLKDLFSCGAAISLPEARASQSEAVLPGYLAAARRIFAQAEVTVRKASPLLDPAMSEHYEQLRWFAMPGEAQCHIQRRARLGSKQPILTYSEYASRRFCRFFTGKRE